MKTISFSETDLQNLSRIVQSKASNVSSALRWAEDREEASEWEGLAEIISHDAYCKYRQKFAPNALISVTLPESAWKRIRVAVKNVYQSTKTAHPIYTKMYPEQIAEFKAWLNGKLVGKRPSNGDRLADIRTASDAMKEGVQKHVIRMQNDIERDRTQRSEKRVVIASLLKRME